MDRIEGKTGGTMEEDRDVPVFYDPPAPKTPEEHRLFQAFAHFNWSESYVDAGGVFKKVLPELYDFYWFEEVAFRQAELLLRYLRGWGTSGMIDSDVKALKVAVRLDESSNAARRINALLAGRFAEAGDPNFLRPVGSSPLELGGKAGIKDRSAFILITTFSEKVDAAASEAVCKTIGGPAWPVWRGAGTLPIEWLKDKLTHGAVSKKWAAGWLSRFRKEAAVWVKMIPPAFTVQEFTSEADFLLKDFDQQCQNAKELLYSLLKDDFPHPAVEVPPVASPAVLANTAAAMLKERESDPLKHQKTRQPSAAQIAIYREVKRKPGRMFYEIAESVGKTPDHVRRMLGNMGSKGWVKNKGSGYRPTAAGDATFGV